MKKTVFTLSAVVSIMSVSACGAGVEYAPVDDSPVVDETNTVQELPVPTESVETDSSQGIEWNVPEVDMDAVASDLSELWDSASADLDSFLSDFSESSELKDFFGESEAPGESGEGDAYNRSEMFYSGWSDVNGSGCDTRQDILQRDLENVILDGCTVLSGTYYDYASGQIIEYTAGDSYSIDIDHVVPLHYAWQNGADSWTQEKREAFAQDEANLIAMDAYTNRSVKGDKGPSQWMPVDSSYHCSYAQQFKQVADDYGVVMTSADAAAVEAAC